MTATEFLFGLTGIVIAIGIIGAIVKKAHEYGMRVFLSKEYGALILGAILAIVASLSIEPNETGLIVGAGLAALFFALVMIQNIKKSSFVFGIIFTIFQTLMLLCFVLLVVAIFQLIDRKARKA